jgi:hypothetical protein
MELTEEDINIINRGVYINKLYKLFKTWKQTYQME